MAKKSNDITKTGPQSYRELQKANKEAYIKASSASSLAKLNQFTPRQPIDFVYEGLEKSPLLIQSGGKDYWGNSIWDSDSANQEEYGNLSDIRAENQPRIVKAFNGIAKGTILAGTTFVDGTAGLLAGIGQTVYNAASDDPNKHWYQGIWDNPITNLMGQINELSEEYLPNYRTQIEQERPWYSIDNLISTNFIFDTVIKNMGFTIGAAFAGGIYTKAISWAAKAIGAGRLAGATAETIAAGQQAMEASRASKATKALVGSFFSAHAEAVQEAYNAKQDFLKKEEGTINNKADEQRDAALVEFLNNGGMIKSDGSPSSDSNPIAVKAYQEKLKQIDEASALAKQEAINQSAYVGTMDGILNLGILWASNLAMFGKMYAGGWKSARNAERSTVRATKEAVKEAKLAAEAGDPTKLNNLKSLVAKAEESGFQNLSKEEKQLIELYNRHILGKKTGAVYSFLKGPVREGNEEMAQGAAAQASMYKYEEEVDKIFDAKLDLEATHETRDVISSILEGFKNQYGDIDNYEEAFVGAITGLLGSPTFGRRNNSTDQTYLGKSKWMGLSGGAIVEARDFLNKRKDSEKAARLATEVMRNDNLADNIKHLIAQSHFNDKTDKAIIHDDEKEYKDARTASIFEMISHLKRVNRLDLLQKAMYATTEFTDEDIAEIVAMTSKQISASTPEVEALNRKKSIIENKIKDLQNTIENTIEQYGLNLDISSEDQELIGQCHDQISQLNKELNLLETDIRLAKPITISPYIKEDGTPFSAEEVKEDIDKRIQNFQKILDTITLAQEEIDNATSEVLTNEQLDTLTWYRVMMKDWEERSKGITDRYKEIINTLAADPDLKKIIDTINDVDDILKEAKITSSEAKVQLGGVYTDLKKVKQYQETLQQLQEALSKGGIVLAQLLSLETKMPNTELTLGEIISKQLKSVVQKKTGKSEDSVNSIIKDLSDLKSIGQSYRKYNELLSEYLNNPEKIDKAHSNSINRADQQSSDKNRAEINQGINWNTSAGNIARQLKAKKQDIDNAGGFDKFLENLTPEQRQKAKQAQKLVMGLDDLNELMDKQLDDKHAEVLNMLIDDNLEEVDDLDGLISQLKDDVIQGVSEEKLEQLIPDDLEEGLSEKMIEAMERALSDFLDNIPENLINAVEEAQKALDDEQEEIERMASAITQHEQKLEKDSEDGLEEIIPEEDPEEIIPEEDSFNPLSDDELNPPSDDITQNNKSKEDENKDDEDDQEYKKLAEEIPKVNPTSDTDVSKQNKSIPPQVGQSGYNRRRQVSQYYLQGEDKETLPKHYEDHPEDIPDGVDKDAFLKYIRAVHKKLVESGAYTYISGTNPNFRLKEDQEIRFTTDETLNKEAGVPVILMVVTDENDNDQIIGSLPTSLDFQAKKRGSNKTVGETHPEDKALYDALCEELIGDTSQKQYLPKALPEGSKFRLPLSGGPLFRTDRQLNANEAWFEAVEKDGVIYFVPILGSTVRINGIKSSDAVTNSIDTVGGLKQNATEFIVIEPGEAVKHDDTHLIITKKAKVFAVTPSTPFAPQTESTPKVSTITTKVEALRGGRPSFSSQNRSVSEVFGNNPIPIQVITRVRQRTSSTVTDPLSVISPAPGQIYVYVTANNGVQIPLLCVSTPLKSLDENDWYIQQTVGVIQELSNELNIGKTKSKLIKWLPSLRENLHINIIEAKNGKQLFITWGELGSDKYPVNKYSINLQNDGTISERDAKLFIQRVAKTKIKLPKGNKMFPTISVDYTRLNDAEYMSNIARYLRINVTENSPRTIDDWFTYKPTKIQIDAERGNSRRSSSRRQHEGKEPPIIIVEISNEPVEVSSTGAITKENGEQASLAESVEALEEVLKEQKEAGITLEEKGKDNFSIANLHGRSNKDLDMPTSPRRNRRQKPRDTSRPLKVSDTQDQGASQDQIDKELEKLSKLFPKLAKDGRIILVDGLIKIVNEEGNPEEAYGLFKNGVLYISNKSPKGTAFHEAFHYVIESLLNNVEKEELFKEASKIFGNMQPIALEEKLAEEFRNFMNDMLDTTIKGRIKSVFQGLKHLILSLVGREPQLDSLFWSIYRGKMKNRTENISSNTFKQELLEYKSEKFKYKNLDQETKDYIAARQFSQENYEKLSIEQKEILLQCM